MLKTMLLRGFVTFNIFFLKIEYVEKFRISESNLLKKITVEKKN